MKISINYLKKIYKVLVWPILFGIGHFTIIVIFTLIYNNSLSINNKELLEYIKTTKYQTDLNQYLSNNQLLIVLITSFIFVPIFINIYKKYQQNYNKKIDIKNLMFLAIFGMSISFVFNISAMYINNIFSFTNLYSEPTIKTNIIITIICTGILGPIIEEYLFRGIVYNRLLNLVNKRNAIIITSLIFAFMHNNYVDMIYAFIISIILIQVLNYYKTIKAPIIVHMGANTSVILFLNFIDNNYITTLLILLIGIPIIGFALKRMNLKLEQFKGW